ncbi:FecR family protein [Leptospira interrogans]
MTNDHQPTSSALEAAVDWLIRQQAAALDETARQEFEAWLAQSDRHRDAWAQAQRTWQAVGHTSPRYEHLWKHENALHRPSRNLERPKAGQLPATGGRALRRSSRRLVIAMAAAAALCLWVFGPAVLLRLQADHMTATGENRTVTLQDGSVVELAGGSAIQIAYSAEQRHVSLLAGEAFFDVVPNKAQPFVVDAGDLDVTVRGTAFNVQLGSNATSVELARGSVGVALKDRSSDDPARLAPGETVTVRRTTGAMIRGNIPPEEIAAWRDRRIFVTDATVSSVVEQMQRYHHAWISLPDPVLAAQKVTGLYDLNDPDRALRALVQPFGGRVRHLSSYVRLVSRF